MADFDENGNIIRGWPALVDRRPMPLPA